MRRHSTFRSGNPTLNSKVFENFERPKSGPLLRDDVMTIQGTVDKTGISLALLIFAGYFAYVPNGFSFMIIGGLGGFVFALITIFKKTWAPITCRNPKLPLYWFYIFYYRDNLIYKSYHYFQQQPFHA